MITLEGDVGSFIQLKGTAYNYFAGNNYLGMANCSEVIEAAKNALTQYGVNFAASRQTTGTADIHLKLEEQLAHFKQTESAMIFASGYMGNKLWVDYLKDNIDIIITDSMAHSSILDAVPRSIRQVTKYDHGNMNQLEMLLNHLKHQRVLIATDGIFALTGEITPLDEIYALAEKHKAFVLVDDAHATGILGENGRGTPEYFNLNGVPNLFQSETMSKALGSYGGFISGTTKAIQTIRKQSAFYGASTALPPAIAAASLASLTYLEKHPERRNELHKKISFVKNAIHDLGYETTLSPTPIVPLFFKQKEDADHLSNYLNDHKIIAPVVDYPVKTALSIVRITLSANHSEEQCDKLILSLKNWKNQATNGKQER